MNLMANRFLDECSLTKQPSGSEIGVIDQESQEPPEETSMLIWDFDHLIPFNDVFEVQGPPTEIMDIQT
jgi:hypothetical protein